MLPAAAVDVAAGAGHRLREEVLLQLLPAPAAVPPAGAGAAVDGTAQGLQQRESPLDLLLGALVVTAGHHTPSC